MPFSNLLSREAAVKCIEYLGEFWPQDRRAFRNADGIHDIAGRGMVHSAWEDYLQQFRGDYDMTYNLPEPEHVQIQTVPFCQHDMNNKGHSIFHWSSDYWPVNRDADDNCCTSSSPLSKGDVKDT